MPASLIDACIKAAAEGDYWRVQRRLLEQLPEDYTNRLLQLLLDKGVINAAALNLFKYSASSFAVPPTLRPIINAEWLSYLADFRFLSDLDLSLCPKLKDVHVGPLQRLHPCLQHLSLRGCKGITAKAGHTLSHLTGLRSLDLSDTGIMQPITASLAPLTQLSSLNLGGQPTSDACCEQLAKLTQLHTLTLWGAQISERGISSLAALPSLSHLDVSWSSANVLPILPSVSHLKMSHCTVSRGWSPVYDVSALDNCQLTHLDLTGTRIEGEGWLVLEELLGWSANHLQVLNLSGTRFSQVHLLQTMHLLKQLDISGCQLQSPHSLAALLGSSCLTSLCLDNAALGTEAAAVIGLLPQLQTLSLRNTGLQDSALPWLLYLTSLSSLSLNNNTQLTGRLLPPPTTDPTQQGLMPAVLLDLPDELMPAVADEAVQGRVVLPHHVLPASTSSSSRNGPLGYQNIWAADSSAGQQDEGGHSRYTQVIPPSEDTLQQGWSHLTNLVHLELGGTDWSNEGCQGLAGHKALRELVIGSKAVKDKGLVALSKIPHLVHLTLKDVRATDSAWSYFDGHPSLREVHVTDCPLMTKAGLQALWDELPALTVVTENGKGVGRSSDRTPPSRKSSSNPRGGSPALLSQSPGLSTSPIIPLHALHLRAYDQRFKYERQELMDVRNSVEAAVGVSLPEEVTSQLPLEIKPRLF